MEKDMIRNLSIGFIIGFFIGWWWTREIVTSVRIFAMIIIGLIGAGFGYIETITVRKRNKDIAEGKKVKWWQKEKVKWWMWALIVIILMLAIFIFTFLLIVLS